MTNDTFELSCKLAELNNTLRNIASLLILRERHESETITDDQYKELLSVIASNLIKG